jgi:hypothetical protein
VVDLVADPTIASAPALTGPTPIVLAPGQECSGLSLCFRSLHFAGLSLRTASHHPQQFDTRHPFKQNFTNIFCNIFHILLLR